MIKFEWDEKKNKANIAKHGFSFSSAQMLFHSKHHVVRSPYISEERFIAIGRINKRVAVIVFTYRHDKIRIISIRRARKDEERLYQSYCSKA